MTVYNFDEVIDRRHTDCLKFDFAVQRGRPVDVLPFWVADMNFPIAREIKETLIKRCEHGIFGPEGEAFERINVACPRETLLQGLEELRAAVEVLYQPTPTQGP